MKTYIMILLIVSSVFLVACTTTPEQPPVKIANPATEFCIAIGGTSDIRTAADGSQTGFCILNGKECDEWTLYRQTCTDIIVCTEDQQENTACTMQYDPVCGNDAKTYGNSCTACSSGAKAYTQGECNVECSGTCPQFMPPSPDFCNDGQIFAGELDECNCRLPPKCVR